MSEQRIKTFSASSNAAAEEQEIRDLLRGAGPRPVVAVEDLTEIRSAAREGWQEMVRMERERKRFRRRRNVMALAASLVLAVAVGWWLKPRFGPVAGDLVATVEKVRGQVVAGGFDLSPGFEVLEGSVVETAATESSRVALRLADGQSVRLDVGTRVRLGSGSRIELEQGALYVDTANSLPGVGVEISTPYGRVRDIGTQFEVRMGDAGAARLMVRVREGEVALERGVKAHSAKAGEQLTLLTLQGDAIVRAAIKPTAASWSWAVDIAPSMDTDGATISSYLEWVSREMGLHLRYSEQSLVELAEANLILGGIEGMTLKESLDVVLSGSDLGYQFENGSLLIKKPVR